MKLLWINGWGIPKSYLQEKSDLNFPDCQNRVLGACPKSIAEIEESEADFTIGYSLGAFLVQKYGKTNKCILLAPFCDFKEEAKKGSRVKKAQLSVLKKWLKIKPIDALNDFYRRAGIDLVIEEVPYPIADLLWGLDVLLNESIEGLIETISFLGKEDKLLHAEESKAFFSQLKILKGAGHEVEDLMKGLNFAL